MQTEIEAKFLNIDHDQIRAKLKKLGAKCEQPMRTMKRAIIDYPDRRLQTKQDSLIRVRDEGGKITLTYKEYIETGVEAAREIETTVGSYEQTVQLFKAIGLRVESEQDTKRETWTIDGCDVELDEWPWLKPYIEIEGKDEATIRDVADKLGFDWTNAVFGGVTVAYKAEYPGIKDDETVGMIPVVRFGDPMPEWLKARKK